MTREEIVKGLDKIGDFFRARANMAVGDGKMMLLNWMKCAEEAAEALKAQEPMKPVVSEEKYGDHLDHCPSCERALPNSGVYGKSYYCYKCGQAVMWK